MNSTEILEQWLAAINRHDVDALAALMSADHVFVDSLGNRVAAAKSMEAGWRGYFAMCPDYWIRVDHAMAEGETMLIAGEAGGTMRQPLVAHPGCLEAGDPRRPRCRMASVCRQQTSLRNPGKASNLDLSLGPFFDAETQRDGDRRREKLTVLLCADLHTSSVSASKTFARRSQTPTNPITTITAFPYLFSTQFLNNIPPNPHSPRSRIPSPLW